MMNLCGQTFEGPLELDSHGVQHQAPGVYAVVCSCHDGAKRMVDVQPADAIDVELRDPERRRLWMSAYDGPLEVYVWYRPESEARETVEQLAANVKERYDPMCLRPYFKPRA
jgi:hypothetical protein